MNSSMNARTVTLATAIQALNLGLEESSCSVLAHQVSLGVISAGQLETVLLDHLNHVGKNLKTSAYSSYVSKIMGLYNFAAN